MYEQTATRNETTEARHSLSSKSEDYISEETSDAQYNFEQREEGYLYVR